VVIPQNGGVKTESGFRRLQASSEDAADRYAGIDESLEASSVCVVDGAGKIVRDCESGQRRKKEKRKGFRRGEHPSSRSVHLFPSGGGPWLLGADHGQKSEPAKEERKGLTTKGPLQKSEFRKS